MKKIATIMEVTENFGVKVFVNARTDSLRYFEGDKTLLILFTESRNFFLPIASPSGYPRDANIPALEGHREGAH